jgi:hypothetical protein
VELFGELEDALDRKWEIAQRCDVKLEKAKEPFPKFDLTVDDPANGPLLGMAEKFAIG